MRTKLISLALALCALGAVLPAGTAAGASISRAHRLGAVNTISGDHTGYVPVTLDTAALLDYSAFAGGPKGFTRFERKGGPTPDIDIAGGDFAGFMLTRADHPKEPVVMAGTFGACTTECAPGAPTNFSYPISTGKTIRLAAGDYRLYLLAVGGHAEVTFRLRRGPIGSARFAPVTSTMAGAHSATAEPDQRNAFSESFLHESVSDGFGIGMLVVEGAYSVEDLGVCLGGASGGVARPCGPGFGVEREGYLTVGPAMGGRQSPFYYFDMDLGLTAGQHSIGGWFASATPAERLTLVTLTVDYETAGG